MRIGSRIVREEVAGAPTARSTGQAAAGRPLCDGRVRQAAVAGHTRCANAG